MPEEAAISQYNQYPPRGSIAGLPKVLWRLNLCRDWENVNVSTVSSGSKLLACPTHHPVVVFLSLLVSTATIIFFLASSIRHQLFHSGAWDLGIFDQAVYLISQGEPPLSSFLGFPILGDHCALILYPLSLLYRLYPSVYWLFAVQALALALGSVPVYVLARAAALGHELAGSLAIAYLLYPLLFNLSLFDFHPEVIALPALLGAVVAARRGHWIAFGALVALVLSCKAVLGLTVAALGIWLAGWEKRYRWGVVTTLAGLGWFGIAYGVIVPLVGGPAASINRQAHRFSYLGNTAGEIARNLFLDPGAVIVHLFTLDNLLYLILVALPVGWAFSWSGLGNLIPALPTLGINLLADVPEQKNLVDQYSLAVLPFLFVMAAQIGKGWHRRRWLIIGWSLAAFLALAKYGYFGSIYLDSLDTWQATREAVALVRGSGGVLTTHDIAPHLSHREVIKFTDEHLPPPDWRQFDYVLLNVKHPGWLSSPEFAQGLVRQLQHNPRFHLVFSQDQVYLFQATGVCCSSGRS